MNKLRTLLPAVFMMAAAVLTSCSDDGDLEDRLDNVENILGTNEPLKVDFATTNSENEAVTNKTSYLFKSPYYTGDGIWDYQDGTYYISVERFNDVDQGEYDAAWFSFEYTPETKEVTDVYAGTSFIDNYGSGRYANFQDNQDGSTLEVEVLSFNPETGKINVKVTASTDASYGNNMFAEKTMALTISFKGKLNIYESSND